MRYRREDRPGREAFTFLETTVALAVLGLALGLVAEVGVWVLQERGRLGDHEAMQELADNVLERARACPRDELNAEWAARQRLPEAYVQRGWRLEVRVADEEGRPAVRRVTVTVRPPAGTAPAPQPVELVGLFAGRAAAAKGEKR